MQVLILSNNFVENWAFIGFLNPLKHLLIMRKTLFVLILGIAIGAIAALLYAPQSGKKTRKKLGKRARKLQLEFEAQSDRNFDRFQDWRNSVEEMAEDTVKRMNGTNSAELN